MLIIDDEEAIRRLVQRAAERGGFAVDAAATAAEGLAMARRPGVEVVLLDLGLPDRDGLELIPLLKAAERTVVVLTARGEASEKVIALDLGADDYLVKPFDTDELLARLRVAFRHRGAGASDTIDAGAVRIDVARHEVVRDGVPVALTRKEFALLVELARFPGRVLTHRHLLEAVWGAAHTDDVAYLRVAMRGLRRKLEQDAANPKLLINEPGIGYRLTAD